MEQNQKHKNLKWLKIGRRPEMAFTLVELMVAIVVLSIGFFAAASMQISAVDSDLSANRMTEAIHLAQGRIEELMALEYTQVYTDPDLIGDAAIAEGAEPYTDSNGNGLRDFKEPYTDSNGNGVWDAAHVDTHPPPGFTITWSVTDCTPVNLTKHIRVYVTRNNNKGTTMLTCIKSRE
jgi:prepilin-type N-terminal cleavage/methylation domain-containing protein